MPGTMAVYRILTLIVFTSYTFIHRGRNWVDLASGRWGTDIGTIHTFSGE